MKILHYNVHMWTDAEGVNNADQVEELLRNENPDLVSLVEVDEPWGHPSTLATIAERLGYCWAFVPAFEYQREGGFGNALLSRTPFTSVQQWQLLPPSVYDGTEPSEPRAILLATVDIEDERLTIGSTHLPREHSAMRNDASARLLERIERLSSPWIICGDFNQAPSGWLAGRYAVTPKLSLATYPTSWPTECIDYAIFGGLELKAQTIQWAASDHLPIVVTS